MLEGEVSVDLKVRSEALDGLKGDVVQGSSIFRAAVADEILGGFLIAVPYLEPFVSAQVIGEPGLAAFALTANPVAEYLAVVCVPLLSGVASQYMNLPVLLVETGGSV